MAKKKQPLVSIIIPNYNKGKYIKEAIDSALNQTYKNIEVIVVDDGSTDESIDIIKSYGKRIKAYFLPHKNANFARNFGIKKSKGEYIQFLDSDDIITKDKIEKQLKMLLKGNYDIVTCWWMYLREKENGIFIKEELRKPDFCDEPLSMIVDPYFSPICAYLMKRKIAEIGFDEKVEICQDTDFIVNVIIKNAKFQIYKEVLYYYRIAISGTTFSYREEKRRNTSLKITEKLFNYYEKIGWNYRRKWFITRLYGFLARYFYGKDKEKFRKCVQRLYYFWPNYTPDEPFKLKLLSKIFGYPNAEFISYLYRKFKKFLINLICK